MTTQSTKINAYIPSLEGSAVYDYTFRKAPINIQYDGMIPNSLQLNKLQTLPGFKLKQFDKKLNKYYTNDLINMKFESASLDSESLIKKLTSIIEYKMKQLSELDATTDAKQMDKIQAKIEQLSEAVNNATINADTPEFQKVTADQLRAKYYAEGFTLNVEGKDIEYVQFSRSTSKSRVGEVLFIKKALLKTMEQWQRMGMKFKDDEAVDLVSLRAYESLVGSALDSMVNIPIENILIVDDIKSHFKKDVSLVTVDANKKVVVNDVDNYDMTTDLFDGESLMDSSLFTGEFEGKGFMLLRNHFFKSCAFNTNVQLFLQDNCPEGTEYKDMTVTNMFGEIMKAEDVKLIITPNSLKALKFAYKIKTRKKDNPKQAMWKYWSELVASEGNVYGVCKTDKASKAPVLADGTRTRSISYQMVNSFLATPEEVTDLLQIELAFIDSIKNNNDIFVDYIDKTSVAFDTAKFYVDMYRHNSMFASTQMFKDFKKAKIASYVKKVKGGNVRVEGDYLTMVSNPIEFLKSVVGSLGDVTTANATLKNNEVYTKLFGFNQELTLNRNPHTNFTNTFVAVNTANEDIEKYMNINDNIIVVNSIESAISSVLSGADFDSDTVHVSNNKTILQVVKKASNYRVVESGIKQLEAKAYTVSDSDMATADSIISRSKTEIGEVVNTGAMAMSLGQHLQNIGNEDYKKLYELTNVVAKLSECAIDSAKKTFEIKISTAVLDVARQMTKYVQSSSSIVDWGTVATEDGEQVLRVRPDFFKLTVDKSKESYRTENFVYTKFECAMSYLQDSLDKNVKRAKEVRTVQLADLLSDKLTTKDTKPQQIKKLQELAIQIEKDRSQIYLNSKDFQFDGLSLVYAKFENEVNKLKLNQSTLNMIIKKVANNEIKGDVASLMKAITTAYPESIAKMMKK